MTIKQSLQIVQLFQAAFNYQATALGVQLQRQLWLMFYLSMRMVMDIEACIYRDIHIEWGADPIYLQDKWLMMVSVLMTRLVFTSRRSQRILCQGLGSLYWLSDCNLPFFCITESIMLNFVHIYKTINMVWSIPVSPGLTLRLYQIDWDTVRVGDKIQKECLVSEFQALTKGFMQYVCLVPMTFQSALQLTYIYVMNKLCPLASWPLSLLLWKWIFRQHNKR